MELLELLQGVQRSIEKLARSGLKRLDPDLTPVMVVSHERSGTHFTMNSLAACFGYASVPWIDFDSNHLDINFYHPKQVDLMLQGLARLRAASIIKSHHEYAFFDLAAPELKGMQIVYVHRRPADVMNSFWRLIHGWPWREGPRTASAFDLANAAPMGHLMRYQLGQHETMLDRWAHHVSGWLDAAERFDHVHAVRYEDLAGDFEGTIRRLGEALGAKPIRIVRPPRDLNVVKALPTDTLPPQPQGDRERVWRLALRRHPELMQRLGYVFPPGERSAA